MFRWLAIGWLLVLICGSAALPIGEGVGDFPQVAAQQKVVAPPPNAVVPQPPPPMPPVVRRSFRPTIIPNEPVKRDQRGDPLPHGALVRYGSARLRHGPDPFGLGFSHDCKVLASLSQTSDGLRLWDPATGKELYRYNYPVTRAGFVRDGSMLILDENRCRVWIPSANTWRELPEKTMPEGTHFIVAHPNSRSFVACSPHKVLQIDIQTGTTIREFKCPTDQAAVRAIFSPDGRWLAGAGQKTGVWLWDLHTGKRVRTYPSEFDFPEFAFNADGTRIAIAAERLFIYPTDAEEPIESFKSTEVVLHSLRFSADGKHLFGITEEGTVNQYDSETGESKELGNSPEISERARLALAPEAAFAAATDENGGILVWDPRTGMGPEEDRLPSLFNPAFAADGKTVWCNTAQGNIHAFEATSGKQTKVIDLPIEEDAFIAWDCRTRRAIALKGSGEEDIELQVIDVDTNRVIHKFLTRINANNRLGYPLLSFCATDETRIAVFDVGSVSVVNVITGKTIRTLKVDSTDELQPPHGAISPDGRLIAVNSQPLSLWEISTGKKRFELNTLLRADGVVFSPDGRSLASWDSQGNVVAVDARLGTTIRRVQVSAGADVAVRTVAFSPDGKRLAAGDYDGYITVWDLASGHVLASFDRHEGVVTGLAFSPDGTTLASTSQDGTVLIWEVTNKLPRKPDDPTVGGLEEAFRLLASPEAGSAQRAMEYFYRRPAETIRFCNEKFPVPTATPPDKISKLISDLDSEDFPVRQAAVKDLEAIGGEATTALRKVADNSSNPEARKLASEVLTRYDSVTPRAEDLTLLRVMELLENIGTPEAKAVLAKWAAGPAGHRMTVEASAAIARMKVLNK